MHAASKRPRRSRRRRRRPEEGRSPKTHRYEARGAEGGRRCARQPPEEQACWRAAARWLHRGRGGRARPHGVQGELRLKVYNPRVELLAQKPRRTAAFARRHDARREHRVRAQEANKALLVAARERRRSRRAEALRDAESASPARASRPSKRASLYACDIEGARRAARVRRGDRARHRPPSRTRPVTVLLVERAAGNRARGAVARRLRGRRRRGARRGRAHHHRRPRLSAMRVDVVTLFPGAVRALPDHRHGGPGRLLQARSVCARRSPRDLGLGRHRAVDDTPYGGGSGMVMRVDCIVDCLRGARRRAVSSADEGPPARAHRVLLCPQGAPFHPAQGARARRSAARSRSMCRRYEGFDDRGARLRRRGDQPRATSCCSGERGRGHDDHRCVLAAHPGRARQRCLRGARVAQRRARRPPRVSPVHAPRRVPRGPRARGASRAGNHAQIDALRLAEAERRTRERARSLGRGREAPREAARAAAPAEERASSPRPARPPAATATYLRLARRPCRGAGRQPRLAHRAMVSLAPSDGGTATPRPRPSGDEVAS